MSFDTTPQATGNESPVSVSAPSVAPVTMRELADPASSRKSLYDGVLNAMAGLPPVQSKTHQLALQDVHYVDPDEDTDDDEETAMNERRTLGRRIKGTWVLSDIAGNQLDKKTQILGVVPKINENGSVIFNGSRYGIGTQRRIRPGFYARVKKNGELESLTNVARGTGSRHRYLMDPETGLFSFNVHNSKIPIADVLDTLGATKEETEAAWGKELSDINWAKRDPKATQKLFEKLTPMSARDAGLDHEGKKLAIQQAFTKMLTDREVNIHTLGMDSDKVDKSTILAATKKIMDLHRGGIEADDRDHPSFQQYYGPEDVFAERIKLDAGKIRRQLLYKAQRNNSLGSLGSGPLDKQLQSALMDSGLGALVDAPNPLDILDRMTRSTVYGDGGIGSLDSTPDSTRNVNHAYSGFVDPLRTVESGRVGADTFLAAGVRKGDDGQLYTPMLDAKTGERKYVSAKDVFGKVITESKKPDVGGRYIAMRDGKQSYYKPADIDYVIDSSEDTYNNLSNLVPGKVMMVPHRTAMATRMLAQSVELVGREAPLFQNGVRGTDGRESYEMQYGKRLGARYAPAVAGTVISVTPKRIEYLTDDGQKGFTRLAADSTLGRKSRIHNEALVQVGQRFEPGQLIASSNFTDTNGVAALGTNLRVADMTHPEAYEDAYVVSESAARHKLASVGLYQNRIESDAAHERDTKAFISVFGGKFQPDQIRKLGNDGVIKVGQKVDSGDPLILAMERSSSVDRVHHKGRDSFKDVSLTWDHDDPGEVVGVFKDKAGNTNVKVRTINPLQPGDKIAMRNGLKGVAVIKPDSEMPTDANGVPFEAIVPRLGVISRNNPVVKAEVSLAKIARKRGEAYRIPDFAEIDDMRDFVRDELAKHQLDEKEEVTDPITGKKIPGILTGEAYFTKLHHYAESKVQGRSTGKYTAEGLPAKGGDDLGKSKRIGLLAQHALLAGGGHEFIRGTGLIRGQADSQFLQAFMRGDQPPEPKVPERYTKFMELLKVAGVNPLRRGTKTTLTPMTDDEVRRVTGNSVVRNGETLDLYKDQKPIPGGLMDPKIFGDGDRPARMILSEALPNPAYEPAIKRILGLKNQEFRDLLAGKHEIPNHGTGTNGLMSYLKSFDVQKELAKARTEIKDGGRMKRDAAVKRLGFLKAMENMDIKPTDLMRSEVFVLPPRLRPITVVGNAKKQVPLVSDLNYLYRELFDADSNLRDLKGSLGEEGIGEERLAVYDALAALGGQEETTNQELRQKSVKGALRILLPGGPKSTYMQRKLLGNTADASGRGVVLPSSKLGMDDVGIPRKMAWGMFANHIVRDLVRRGMPIVAAREAVTKQTSSAEQAMQRVLEKTPVLMTRDPALHQFNTIGQKPVLVDGNSIRVNTLVVKGLSMDFDGDQQIGKVIVSLPSYELHDYSTNYTKKALITESDTVVSESLSTKHNSLLAEIPMSSITKAGLPVRHEANVFICDLEDFPRLVKLRSSDGRCGHIDWYSVPEGLQVLAIDPLTQQVQWADVTDWSVHHGCSVEIVTLRSGRQIFTDDDPRGLIACIPALGMGTRSCSPTEAFSNNGMVPRAQRFDSRLIEEELTHVDVDACYRPKESSDILPERLELSEDIGWFVGVMCGNGWAEGCYAKKLRKTRGVVDSFKFVRKFSTRGICMSDSYPPVRKRFSDIVAKLLTPKASHADKKHVGDRVRKASNSPTREEGYADSHTVVVQNTGLGRLVRSWIGTKAGGKHLPPFFLQSTHKFRLGILMGLLDTDGSISVSNSKKAPQLMVSYTSTSLRLCRELSLLSSSLGVRSRVGFSKTTEAGNTCWIVSFNARDVQDLVKKSPKSMIHATGLHTLLNTTVSSEDESGVAARYDQLPITPSLAGHLSKLVTSSVDASAYTTLRKACREHRITRMIACKVESLVEDKSKLSQHPDWKLFWHWACDRTVTWETIEKLEQTNKKEVGYDITVPGYENWMNIDGVFCPNTASIHVPITTGEINNIKNRLMPSKMLISPQDFKSPMYAPNQDYMLGVSLASVKRNQRRTPKVFRTEADAERALEAGVIDAHDPVHILEDDDKDSRDA